MIVDPAIFENLHPLPCFCALRSHAGKIMNIKVWHTRGGSLRGVVGEDGVSGCFALQYHFALVRVSAQLSYLNRVYLEMLLMQYRSPFDIKCIVYRGGDRTLVGCRKEKKLIVNIVYPLS
ncbi:hypothetical protein SDJN03_18612, partial [Cucurbita argyrosperma subsp. sororia]